MNTSMSVSPERPIGVFDSGFGGLNILSALVDLMPREDFIYFGDSARTPYGSKDPADVTRYTLAIARALIAEFDVKALVVACNTASSVALWELTQICEIPVVGVIDAAVRAARAGTHSGRVGVVGTIRTIGSGVYQQRMADLEFVGQACPGLVEYVERGELDSEEVTILAERLLEPIRSAEVDTLVLGCTHYPYLARVFQSVLGEDVLLISSAEETAFEVESLVSHTERTRPGTVKFLCSGSAQEFVRVGRILYGESLVHACHRDIPGI